MNIRRILLIGHRSRVSHHLIGRLQRIGYTIRVMVAHQSIPMPGHHASQMPDVERFWGSLMVPMDIMLACADVEGVIVDLAGLEPSTTLLNQPLDNEGHEDSKETHSKGQWRDPQQVVSQIFKHVFGSYTPPAEPPKRHSSWQEKKHPIEIKKVEQKTGQSLHTSPLFEGLINSLPEQLEHSVPLTMIAPSILYNPSNKSLFSDESLAAYQLAGWNPNVILYDWVLDHLGQRLSNRFNPLQSSPYRSGDMSEALLGIITHLCRLRVHHHADFQYFLENKLNLGHLNQSLSLVGMDDFISVTVLIHQLRIGGERYLMRGDQLTWKSLTQLCAHLIDDLPRSTLHEVSHQLNFELRASRELMPTKYPSWLKGIIQLLRSLSSQPHSPITALRSDITSLISRSHGGAHLNRDCAQFSPLPKQFEWSPILTVLEKEVGHLVSRLS